MAVRILVTDDHRMVRKGLVALLQAEEGFEIAGEADDGRVAVQMAGQLEPDVVVMDLRMPNLNGIDATRQILGESPKTKVIGLSANSEARSATEMLRAGATGYVFKQSAFEELATAIRTVVAGEIYLSPSLADGILADYLKGHGREPGSVFGMLSLREREVLQLISEGRATKEVAAELRVSVKTAETHRRNLMEKLHVDSVAGLTKYAIREGLTSV
ncbi:MAG TPA: response regulator transcription factor [Bryobacteraceae bacterium]|nr:response regulator transcription factor [Bryobacteraceae bacterium]